MLLSQFRHRVDRVRGRVALQFTIVDLKQRFAVDGTAQHLQARFRGGHGGVFVRRNAGRHKNDSFEREFFQSKARQNQVGMMNRVEGTAVNADLLQFNKAGIGCARP
jgi:hypothetical protein